MSPADLEKLHKQGERVTIRWPGGPYDFVILFDYAEPSGAAGWEDWLTIHGMCVEPEGPQHHTRRSFYVHPVEGEERTYALLPKRD
ncbi:hypothetical protein [Actinoplanes sp. N902-109]|uniref:hypothetical protein n=1 Tax=Actinoplanes sp. (strain N902-109) TaxID=649831 RepID=UPI00032964E9|nr:hypothetical protein [Actinoplanes sp. N902-109]AGL20943.1 hypothetical protein L083_7433 [Actinoplanes sp. N902-109]